MPRRTSRAKSPRPSLPNAPLPSPYRGMGMGSFEGQGVGEPLRHSPAPSPKICFQRFCATAQIIS